MRLACAAVAVVFTGCGGGAISPELYALVVDAIVVPTSCYVAPPTDTVAKAPLGTTTVTVWDGPEQKAFLLPDSSLSFDMGDAPNVSVATSQALEGTSSATGWDFVADIDVTDVQMAVGTRSINTKTSIKLSFPRTTTGTGTLTLSSSATCTGTGCGTTNPACSIPSIPMRVTRLAVDFERSP